MIKREITFQATTCSSRFSPNQTTWGLSKPPQEGFLHLGKSWTRLERWSIFDSDAMPMFFKQQRCDVDGFWTFLPSQSVRLFLFNHQYRLFSDVFSNLRTDVWRWFFVGKPKNSVYYDMLKFATYCAYISALWVKNIKTKGKQCLVRLIHFFGTDKTLLGLIKTLSSTLGSTQGQQITTIVKEWWFSMLQSQSVRLFLLNHWDRLFSDGFQMTNNR